MDDRRKPGGRTERSSNNFDRFDSKGKNCSFVISTNCKKPKKNISTITGNKIKGRGFFRFNRERSSTPPHWKVDRR